MLETGAVAGIITAAIALGGILGLILRRIPLGVILAATSDNPYIVVALCGAVSVLFGALGKVALVLLERTDKSHAELIASVLKSHLEELAAKDEIITAMARAHMEALAGKDAINAVTQTRCEEWEQRANRYESLAMRTAEAAREAAQVAHVVTEAVVKRGQAQ